MKKRLLCLTEKDEEQIHQQYLTPLSTNIEIELQRFVLKNQFSVSEIEEEINERVDDSFPAKLLRESYFADALLAPKRVFIDWENGNAKLDVHCPVLWHSEHEEGIDHLLFIISDDPSSLTAIKQFCTVFPESCKLNKVTLLVLGDKIEKRMEQMVVRYLQKFNAYLGVHKVHDWKHTPIIRNIEYNERTLSVINYDLISKAEEDCFLAGIRQDEEAALFIGYSL